MVHHAHGVTADYKIDAYRLAQLGFNVLVPSLFNMFGVPGTNAHRPGRRAAGQALRRRVPRQDGPRPGSTSSIEWAPIPARTAAIGHCMGGRLLDSVRGRSIRGCARSSSTTLRVRDEPETSHRPRHAFKLARTLKCASLVFCGGKDFIATPAIQGPLWESFMANGQPVEWHAFSDANHGFRHPDNDGFQPHYADLTWPIVTDFLLRRV